MNVHEQTMKVHDFMNKLSPGLVLVNTCNSGVMVDEKCNTIYINPNIVQVFPTSVMDIRVTPKIWEPRDHHLPGHLS